MEGAMVNCAACGKPFECKAGDIQACGCYQVVLSDAAKEWIMRNNHGCLCTGCLLRVKKKFEEGM